jgi:nitroreductase
MEFFEIVENRHSVRAFKDKEIEEEKVQKLLRVANSAPSAGNLQAYRIFLVRDKSTKEKLTQAAYGQDFIDQAPINLVFCIDSLRSGRRYGKRGETLYSIQDATISCAFVHLSAVNLGLGSVIVGAFNEMEVSRILNIPSTLRPIIILPVGYPDEEPKKTPRRKMDDLVYEV